MNTDKISALNGTNDSFQLDSTTLFGTPYLNSLQEEITVRTNSNRTKFYTIPLLLPGWAKYKEDLEELANNSPPDDEILTIQLLICFWDKDIESELIDEINASRAERGERSISNNDLSIIPHAFFQLEANLGAGLKPIYSSVDLTTVGNGINLVNQTSFKRRRYIPIFGTLRQLNYLYENRCDDNILVGQLYSRGHAVRPTEVSIQARNLLQTKAAVDLVGDETFEVTTKVDGENSSRGLSVNFGFGNFEFGEGDTSVTTSTSKKRIVSRDYVNSLVRGNIDKINITVTGRKDEVDNQVNKLVDFVIASCKRVSLAFEQISNERWKLGNEVFGYINLGKREINEVLNSKPKLDSKYKSNQAVEGGDGSVGGKASSENSHDFIYSNDITWQFDGDDLVPTKVDLHILDESTLLNEINVSWANNIVAEEAKNYKEYFLYPAAALFNQDLYWDSLSKELHSLNGVVCDIESRLKKLERRKIKYTLGARYNGESTAVNGAWTDYRGDGKTPDRIRIWFED